VRRTDGRTNITKTSRHTYRQITRRCAGGMRRCSERMQSGGSITWHLLITGAAAWRLAYLCSVLYLPVMWPKLNESSRSVRSIAFSCCYNKLRCVNSIVMPPPRRGGIKRSSASVVRPSVRPSVCLSDVVYIGSNSKTKRPMKTKLCTGVPQVTCDSHTDFKVKRSKVKVSRGGSILWRPPSRTAC